MGNITYQICSLMILGMLILIFLSRKMLRSFSDKVFFLMLSSMALSSMIDMLATIIITADREYPHIIYNFFGKLYLASIVFTIFLTFLYINIDAIGEKRKTYRLLPISILPMYFGICYIFLLPVSYRVEDGYVVFENASAMVAYGISVYYILVIFFVVQYRKSRMRKEVRRSARLAVILFLVILVIEVENLSVRIASLVFSLVAVYIYMNMKNALDHIDKTVGVFNQDAFEYHLRELAEDGRSAWVIYIGFDDFKTINTTFGYENGRKLFKKVTDTISNVSEGKVFLIDAYEIACVFTGAQNAYRNYRSTIRYKLREDFTVLDARIKVPAYIVEIPVKAKQYDYGELFSIMKKYMAELVTVGQDYILINETHFAELRERNHVRHVIEQAIADEDIQIGYQPVYNLDTGRFDSAEALLRLYDSDGSVIPSDMVISIADDTGLILQLGELIFKKIFSFVTEHKLLGTYLKMIHINLSGVQCASEGIASRIAAQMSRYHVAPAYVDLEIREKAENLKDGVLMENMQSMVAIGSTFSLDDYGKGYANLESIMEWPIQHVKLDKNLVHLESANERREQALLFVLKMAKQLGMDVVAKGVETEEDYCYMKKLNVNYIQGFYLCGVLGEKDFLDFMEKPLIIKKL